MNVWNKQYKQIPIKADYRVHDKVLQLCRAIAQDNMQILDIACGAGALSQRIIDEMENVIVDINDLNRQGILCTGYKQAFCQDLNSADVCFKKKYDLILAVEIIEHIENPWNFLQTLKNHLQPQGVVIMTSPNIDSDYDRLNFLLRGTPMYFGADAIEACGGHITMVPEWLLNHICKQKQLSIVDKQHVDTTPHHSVKFRFLNFFLRAILFLLAKNRNNASINIFAIKHGCTSS